MQVKLDQKRRPAKKFCFGLWVFCAVMCFLITPVAAEFQLPILHHVKKTISVPEDADPNKLIKYLDVKNVAIELRILHFPLSSEWLSLFLGTFHKAPKNLVVADKFPTHAIDPVRRIKPIEIKIIPGDKGISKESLHNLDRLGPILKTIVLSDDFPKEDLQAFSRLTYHTFAIQLTKNSPIQFWVDWLHDNAQDSVLLLIPGDFVGTNIYPFTSIRRLKIEVATTRNRIDPNLLSVLHDLKKAQITLEVDGRVTMQDAVQWSLLEQFSLKIRLENQLEGIPGLVRFLNLIAPPQSLQ